MSADASTPGRPDGGREIRASIIGASGYTGGELLRLLLAHPRVEVAQVTSESNAGKFVRSVHPNLRGSTDLKFVTADEAGPCDLLFLALPHGEASRRMDHFAKIAPMVVDLSADFRLPDVETYARWYGRDHEAPEWLSRFAYGLPEANRDAIRKTNYVSGVGCNATAANLALLPLVRAGLADSERPIVVDLKVGSSEGGNKPSLASHHPERSGAVRAFSPTGHRHTAEVEAVLGRGDIHLSVTSIEMVRGAVATAHVWLKGEPAEKDVWKAFRSTYGDEPFVRIVKDKTSLYRYPEPKILAGTNYADVGFELDPKTGRCVVVSAIDNLVKGAAGSALQCVNVMMGWPEDEGMGFPGLHPV